MTTTTTITVPLMWAHEWPTTGLAGGSKVTVTFDGFGSLVDLACYTLDGVRDPHLAENMESAELEALLDAAARGRAHMEQKGQA